MNTINCICGGYWDWVNKGSNEPKPNFLPLELTDPNTSNGWNWEYICHDCSDAVADVDSLLAQSGLMEEFKLLGLFPGPGTSSSSGSSSSGSSSSGSSSSGSSSSSESSSSSSCKKDKGPCASCGGPKEVCKGSAEADKFCCGWSCCGDLADCGSVCSYEYINGKKVNSCGPYKECIGSLGCVSNAECGGTDDPTPPGPIG